jgi:hypothetical protein
MLQHSNHLEAEYGAGPHTISVPRLRPADGSDLSIRPPYEVGTMQRPSAPPPPRTFRQDAPNRRVKELMCQLTQSGCPPSTAAIHKNVLAITWAGPYTPLALPPFVHCRWVLPSSSSRLPSSAMLCITQATVCPQTEHPPPWHPPLDTSRLMLPTSSSWLPSSTLLCTTQTLGCPNTPPFPTPWVPVGG